MQYITLIKNMAVHDKDSNQYLVSFPHDHNKKQIMETNSGVNPAQDDLRLDIYPDSRCVGHQREPPPPYSADVETDQPRSLVRETIIIQPPLEDSPMYYPCPRCYKRVMTKVTYVNTKKTHLLVGFIFGCTCWCLMCCLAFIPYFIPTFKKVVHHCTECDMLLGEYSKL